MVELKIVQDCRAACALVGLLIWSCFPGSLFAQSDTSKPGAEGRGDTSFFYTSFDGARIHFERHGKGKPLLLVHGFTGSAASWKKTVLYQDLLQRGYMLIIPDLRGNGLSDKPHNAQAYANDAEAKDLMGIMDHLGIDHYDVVGYSRGSIITARLLVLDKRVGRGVMGGMGADFTNPDWPRRVLFYRALSGEPVPELDGMLKYVRQSGLDQEALACQQKEQPSTSRKELAGLRMPVLVVNGDRDRDNGSPEELAGLIPGARLVIVPGDHGQVVGSRAFSEAVLDFLLQ